MTAAVCRYFEYLSILSLILFRYLAECSVRLEISTPVNPVDEAGILSVHCKVWDLGTDYHVIISNDKRMISMGETILEPAEDRFFLAVRQFSDGSIVYFLSIIDVTRSDMGAYFCKVVDSTDNKFITLGAESVQLDVAYFPSVTDPVCQPEREIEIHEGSVLTLNCSSEATIPLVDIQWTRTTSVDDPLTMDTTQDNARVYGTHRFVVTRKHNRAVFVCKITSVAFPDRLQTCHVGPLNVVYSGRGDALVPGSDNQPDGGLTYDIPNMDELIPDVVISKPAVNNLEESCSELCPLDESSVLFWITSTIVTGFVALLFVIFAVVLCVKYWNHQQPMYTRPKYVVPHTGMTTMEEIYVDLEGRQRQNSVYMTLGKSQNPKNNNSVGDI